MHIPTNAFALALTTSLCTSSALADIILRDDSGVDFSGASFASFDSMAAGSNVSSLDFGGIPATVTFPGRTPISNEIVQASDGFGAVGLDGSNFWKVRAESVRIDFGDARLSEFGFSYSDLEWSDLTITFGNVGQYVLSDSNPGRNEFFAYQAAPGEVFGFVTIQWSDDTDGVGFDGMYARQIPAPGGAAFAALVMGLAFSRRSR